jgi:hypothetical protein
MAYETKDNTGSVFQNERKEKDTHPDRTGSAKIGGVDYWVNGWVKQDRNGKPYLSLAFKPKSGDAKAPEPPAPRRSIKDDMDGDSIPF